MASAWGEAYARYYAWAVPSAKILEDGGRPDGPAIWLGWHEANVLAAACYPRMTVARRCHTLVSYGWRGWIGSGWVRGMGMGPVPLPHPGRPDAPASLLALEAVLAAGDDVVLAVDGPRGPAGRVRRGALWLARRTGCPVVPVGAAVRPSWRLPRWDRLLIPVPGATAAFALGQPIAVDPDDPLDGRLRRRVAGEMNALTERAWRMVA